MIPPCGPLASPPTVARVDRTSYSSQHCLVWPGHKTNNKPYNSHPRRVCLERTRGSPLRFGDETRSSMHTKCKDRRLLREQFVHRGEHGDCSSHSSLRIVTGFGSYTEYRSFPFRFAKNTLCCVALKAGISRSQLLHSKHPAKWRQWSLQMPLLRVARKQQPAQTVSHV
jgi:hypothetical protein